MCIFKPCFLFVCLFVFLVLIQLFDLWLSGKCKYRFVIVQGSKGNKDQNSVWISNCLFLPQMIQWLTCDAKWSVYELELVLTRNSVRVSDKTHCYRISRRHSRRISRNKWFRQVTSALLVVKCSPRCRQPIIYCECIPTGPIWFFLYIKVFPCNEDMSTNVRS